MTDIRVEKNGQFYKVYFGDDTEFHIPSFKVEETATEWDVNPELVAQIKALAEFSKLGGKKFRKINWEEFTEGYKKVLELIGPEELICYMIDNLGSKLMYPEEVYKKIYKERIN